MIIKEALDAYAKTLEREFKHDRTKTVGASEIGGCARRTYWAKKEHPGEDQSARYGAHLRGSMMEERFWYPAMRAKYGKRLRWSGPYQKTIVDEFLSATPDGLVVDFQPTEFKALGVPYAGDSVVVESKTLDPRVSIYEEKAEHSYQVNVQLGLVRKFTKYKPEYAVISYIDASFWHEVDEYVVRFDPKLFEVAQQRAKSILKAVHPADLAPEGWIGGGKECEYCPYIKACDKLRRNVPEGEDDGKDLQFSAEMADLAREYLRLKKEEKEIASSVRETQERIKARLREKGVRRIPGVLSWSTIKGRESWDMKGIREEAEKKGLDLEPFCTVGDPTDRLDIRLKGEQ
jgi:CRISPR/Cas system-associated exonuclease Cas4 (RecB family)